MKRPSAPQPRAARSLRKVRPRTLVAACAFVIGVAAVAGWQGSIAGDPPGARPILPDGPEAIANAEAVPHRVDYRRLDARLDGLMRTPGMTGLGVALVEDGQVTFVKGYGRTEPGDMGAPVTSHTVFRWASLSKTVAATMVAKLADQGKLSLDAPIASFGTSLRLPQGTERVATVENLLSHRLGIVKNAYDDRLEDGEDPRVTRASFATLSPLCRAGTCFSYQNIAFDAASEIVQTVTHKSYATTVQRQLFDPLGMANASIGRPGLTGAASWARPTRGLRVLPVLEPYYRVPAAGGVNSSIFDLGLWLKAQMGGNPRVLSPRLLDNLHRARGLVPRGRQGAFDRAMTEGSYALGWRTHRLGGHLLIGHRGAVNGYRSLILFDPAEKVGIAMLWNSESPRPVGVPLEVFDALYGRPTIDYLELAQPK